MRTQVIVPARARSARFPDKPLAMIAGVPMILRTYRQCLKAVPASQVTVATDDIRIVDLCSRAGADVVMTSDECLTGTDRVAEAAMARPADYYVNVQGDEPIFDPEDIQGFLAACESDPDRLLMGFCAIGEDDFRNPSIPKVVFRQDGRLLYISRAAIPSTKRHEYRAAWRQVCIYGFPPVELAAFANQKVKGPLEEIEDCETLRYLEMGLDVFGVELSDRSIAVDHPEDVAKVEAALRERAH
ncbi:3-deoxy-manno-octulosonate cytidylyltransferase [Devosia sp. ZB163]|uniref:3-deoxy-manno-octulosonate cytidylyltransferase n=1 Tax=Devosia sp. ZB163 TaxID=3025938 RepID=UPI00235DF30F|nr:3-deoxy-manno-octulosonate cytidylyltransferase [Devosia sp. ZB163]MDC9826115.1 3-deoxy-manno-octulosonate cytidylyltransferase [Devosia sp. ZB163]